ncbi:MULTISPECIES: amino acid ABC transporter permease [Holzapfeliella]
MNWSGAYTWINLNYLLQGLWITIQVSVISIILSFIFGAILGIIRYSRVPKLSAFVGFLVDIVRNLPLLLIIFFSYFGLPQIGIRFSTFSAAIFAFTIFESAMLAEIFRSGLEAVDKGQTEAARSNGMSYLQTLRYIVFPQGLKKMISPIVSQFISLVKDTSLATIILLPDLMQRAQVIYGQDTNYMIPIFILVAVTYFVVNYVLSLFAGFIDRRLKN